MGRVFLADHLPGPDGPDVDSALHDPDVHPLATRAIHSAPRTLRVVSARIGIESRAPDPESPAVSSPSRKRTHSPGAGWYWSTIATVAVASIWLLKMALSVTLRNRSASAPAGVAVSASAGVPGMIGYGLGSAGHWILAESQTADSATNWWRFIALAAITATTVAILALLFRPGVLGHRESPAPAESR